MTPLRAVDFQAFTVPAGQRIAGVRVEKSGHYDTNATADVGFGDLASLAANWTAAMVSSLQFEVRRRSGRSDTTLRIVSIRLIVTTSD